MPLKKHKVDLHMLMWEDPSEMFSSEKSSVQSNRYDRISPCVNKNVCGLLRDIQETVNSVYLCKLIALHASSIITNNDHVIS